MSSIGDQARQAAEFLTKRYSNGNDLIVGVAAILDDIVPDPDPASVQTFEQGMHDLGLHLGFGAHRPERDTGEGPDVLWSLGELAFLIIECKSGTTTDVIWRHDTEQLSHSMDWFQEKYDHTCTATPVLIHHARTLHSKASARPGAAVITFDKLAELRAAVTKYAAALAAGNSYQDAGKVSTQLTTWRLNGKSFAQSWGVTPRKR